MKKIPHCKECKYCKTIDFSYLTFYCSHDNIEEIIRQISVDSCPKTSPIWCPLRGQISK
jgi:hypothetical protein